jgi:hypothetical protein
VNEPDWFGDRANLVKSPTELTPSRRIFPDVTLPSAVPTKKKHKAKRVALHNILEGKCVVVLSSWDDDD